jgi:hypothetical protein
MNSYESTTCSFIVKIWIETDDATPARPWRGRVISIPMGEEGHFVNLADLCEFIEKYLQLLQADTTTPDSPK